MTAGQLRGMTVNLSANSPIICTLDDGTILDIVEQQMVPDYVPGTDPPKYAGPPTLVLSLRPRPNPGEVNGTHPKVPIPTKVIKMPRGPGY